MKIKEKFKIAIIKLRLRIRKISPNNNLLIFSDPRGGSTWLMELMMQIPKTAVIWEPFHKTQGVVPQLFNFGWRPYVPEHIQREDIKVFFMNLFSGKLQNEWTTQISNINDYLKAELFIFKFVRINAMLPWLTENFTFHFKPIYLLRHPMAVALSQIKAFHKDEQFNGYEIPKVLYNDKYLIHEEFLNTLKTPLEKYIAEWCLHNAETLRNKKSGKDWIIVYYENLLMEPEIEIPRIFSELNIELPSQFYAQIRKPSQMVCENDFIEESKDQLRKWRDRVSISEIEQGEKILQYFNIKNYSCYQTMPLLN